MERQAGVLLNVSSLPGKYGIGGFSCNAEYFLNEFAGMGFRIWQTLPITSLGYGNSPYSGISSYAGNFLYVDPERLDGLLTREELAAAEYKGGVYLTDYEYAYATKERLLRTAYSRADEELKEKIRLFAEENAGWLYDYAAFMTLKKLNGGKSWTEWGEYTRYSAKKVKKILADYPEETGYYLFEQYWFFTQWKKIREHASSLGIKIFGDLPIYVCYDSADVWSHVDEFRLGEDFRPVEVAGVPPDYFAKDGQLWGNPLYDYDEMAKNGYKWWVDRIKHMQKLYDILRIDHFRGLYEYWAVPAGAETAREGKWRKGPQKALFDEIKKRVPDIEIVAEDLGIIDENVEKFLEETGFYGMRVMQFGFDGDKRNKHLPHNYDKNCVAYTATHDNDTTLGWLLSLDGGTLESALNYVACDPGYGWADGAGKCRATRAFIRAVMASTADVAIVPMQDLCGYGSDTRMNTPGQADGCWKYRTNYSAINCVDHAFIRNVITTYGR
ncbi:MAG: 4-alpha-glucanotransferase [Christensenellales bacterium]